MPSSSFLPLVNRLSSAATLLRALAVLVVAAFPPVLPSTAGAAASRLETGFIDRFYQGQDAAVAFPRMRAAGATVFRTSLDWYAVAPVERPKDFRPEDPADPAYRWDEFDAKIKTLKAHGLEPIVFLNYPPVWAGGVTFPSPDPEQVRKFMEAAARRFSGGFRDLPRIRYWQIWNEPNVKLFFSPRFVGPVVTPPALYRLVANAFADGVHAVHPDNLAIAGALSPWAVRGGDTDTIAPLVFMRELLCLSGADVPVPGCPPVSFDVWASHPYTKGGPTRRSPVRDDAYLGDLPRVHRMVRAAARAGIVRSRAPLRFWVTEFSWDTRPPDPRAVPLALQAR